MNVNLYSFGLQCEGATGRMRNCSYSGFLGEFHTGLETQDKVRAALTETEVSSSSWTSRQAVRKTRDEREKRGKAKECENGRK